MTEPTTDSGDKDREENVTPSELEREGLGVPGESGPATDGESQAAADASSESAEAPPVENAQFVDFDMWVLTLEANFGPDFDKVLTAKFGPDWGGMINSRIAAGEDFHELVQELKHWLNGTIDDVREEDPQGSGISFEALGPGEIFGEPGFGPGPGGGNSANSARPPLANLRRKEFSADDKLKVDSQPDKFTEEKLLVYRDKDSEETAAEDELVMMDRRDFSRLSYYASKEMGRHKDEKTAAGGAGQAGLLKNLVKQGPVARIFMLLVALLALYTLFSLGSYLYFTTHPDRLIEQYPPDLILRLSSSLYKQGELLQAGEKGLPDHPVLVYYYRPAVRRLEINTILIPGQHSYEVAVADRNTLVIPSGPGGDSVTVHLNYSSKLPFSPTRLSGKPLLSLNLNGNDEILAYETAASVIFPGLNHLVLRDPDGVRLGEAYTVREFLYVSWEARKTLQVASLNTLSTRMVLLFTLLGN